MSLYTTLTDLIARADGGELTLIELSDTAVPPTGSINVDVVDSAIGDACALIDGYMPVGLLPIAGPKTPRILTRIATDITLYMLASTRHTDAQRVAYEDALRLLRQIRSGELSLGLTVGGAVAPAVSALPDSVSFGASFDRDDLGVYLRGSNGVARL